MCAHDHSACTFDVLSQGHRWQINVLYRIYRRPCEIVRWNSLFIYTACATTINSWFDGWLSISEDLTAIHIRLSDASALPVGIYSVQASEAYGVTVFTACNAVLLIIRIVFEIPKKKKLQLAKALLMRVDMLLHAGIHV